MCVIIHKPADIIIPPEKIESAWENNKDGFGVTFDDRGQFNIRKFLTKEPDEINKFLEELKGCDTMLHLRFKTKGSVDRTNLHPFTVLTKKNDGANLQFYHNGTLSSFGDKDISDTNDFNETIVKPMYKLLAVKYDNNIDAMIDDPFAESVMEGFRNTGSVFCLYGDNGQWIHWGKGVQFDDGWWASNNSYFDSYKRYMGGDNVTNFSQGTHQTTGVTTTGTTGTTTSTTGKPLPTPVGSDKAIDNLGIKNLSELYHYTQESFEDLVLQHPYEAALLLKDLTQELYWTEYSERM